MKELLDDNGKIDPVQFIENNYNDITKVIRSVCRRKTYDVNEIEENVSYVLEKLVQNDYKIIRSFNDDGRATFQSYFFTIVNRLLIDKNRIEKGYFRPSVKAKGIGKYAETLEKLIIHDKYPIQEAYEFLNNDPEFSWTYEYTSQIAGELWRPSKTSIETHEDIEQFSSSDQYSKIHQTPDNVIDQDNLQQKSTILNQVVETAVNSLNHEDSLLLKLKFESNVSVSEISRMFGKTRKVVDRKLTSLLKNLADSLLARGITKESVNELIDEKTS